MNSTQPVNNRSSRLPGRTRWWITGLVAVLISLGLIWYISQPPVVGPPSLAQGKTLGLANAPIVLEEYADFQCPFCGKFARETLKQIEDKYVKNGTVKVVFKHYAKLGEESMRAAEAAECANEQGQFWQYYQTLYTNQAGENQGGFSDQHLVNFAQTLGLDMTAFNTCFSSGKYRAAIQDETDQGSKRSVSRIPTLFVNDQKIVGAISMQQFETIISPLLAK